MVVMAVVAVVAAVVVVVVAAVVLEVVGALPSGARWMAHPRRPLPGPLCPPAPPGALCARLMHFSRRHLGINRNTSTDGYYLPQGHGFDSFYGFPVSNNPKCAFNETTPSDFETCFVMRNNTVVEQPVNLLTLPDRLTNEALRIVNDHAGVRPFFLYYGFVQPHTPIFSSARFQGRSPRGPYGDAIEEIDDAVGRVMDAVRAAGQENNTIVVFTSGAGPPPFRAPAHPRPKEGKKKTNRLGTHAHSQGGGRDTLARPRAHRQRRLDGGG